MAKYPQEFKQQKFLKLQLYSAANLIHPENHASHLTYA